MFKWAMRGPHPVYLGDYTVLLRTAHGFKLYVDTRDVSLAPHLMMDGVWEPAVSKLINEKVRPGMRVAEVGANVGYHSVHLAQRIGAGGALRCFEANPRLAQLLAQSLEVNGLREQARVHAEAAADRVGEAEFKVFERHLGASSFIVADETAKEYHDTLKRIVVPTTTLDVALADWPMLDFLKIDAEGAEPMVLAGAAELLARSPNLQILLEFGPAFWPSLDAARAFLQRLEDQGFSILRLAGEGALEATAKESLLDPTKLAELFLTRKKS